MAFNYNPRKFYYDLNNKERENYLFGLNCKPSEIEKKLDLALNIVFRSYRIKPTQIANNKVYYFGIRRAEIHISGHSAIITDCTSSRLIKIKKESVSARHASVSENIGTSASLGSKKSGVKTEQSIKTESGDGKKTANIFEIEEYELLTTGGKDFDFVEWEFSLPKSSGEYRDLLGGNLELEVKFEWKNYLKHGIIKWSPGQIDVYNSDKQITEKYKLLAMIQLFYKKIFILHDDPIEINYNLK